MLCAALAAVIRNLTLFRTVEFRGCHLPPAADRPYGPYTICINRHVSVHSRHRPFGVRRVHAGRSP